MRIAFYAPLKPPGHGVPSGDRRVARLFLAALRIAGHRVELASRLRSFDAVGDRARQARIRRLGYRTADRLLSGYRLDPPDLWFTYHLYHKAPDWLGPNVANALNIPYVVAEASFAPKQATGPWADGHAAVADALMAARRVICLNPDDVACVAALAGGPHRIEVMKPFMDTGPPGRAAADRPRHRATLAARLGIDLDVPWIVVSAMMRPGDKLASYRLLGESLRRILDRHWVLIVAGDGEARAAVEAALDFGGRVRLLGRLSAREIDSLHAAGDLMAWPAVNEAYGMALLEAQAAGLPVVAGDRPGVRQIVRHAETGLIVTAKDADALATGIGALTSDPERRQAMSRAAVSRTRTDHDVTGAARRLDTLLRDAVAETLTVGAR